VLATENNESSNPFVRILAPISNCLRRIDQLPPITLCFKGSFYECTQLTSTVQPGSDNVLDVHLAWVHSRHELLRRDRVCESIFYEKGPIGMPSVT
jgi:hypothetical protein